jgi:hypothetical protein
MWGEETGRKWMDAGGDDGDEVGWNEWIRPVADKQNMKIRIGFPIFHGK